MKESKVQYQEFVKKVREQAKLNSEQEAVQAVDATLITLAERLAGNEGVSLASELPHELGKLFRTVRAEPGEDFGVDEFLARVKTKQGIDRAKAMANAQAVITVLGQAISKGQFQDMCVQFPPEYKVLFASANSSTIQADHTQPNIILPS